MLHRPSWRHTMKKVMRTIPHLLAAAFAFAACAPVAFAAATITPATGGSAISADTVNGTSTPLAGPVITEANVRDIGLGTIVLAAPAGFAFDASHDVTATVETKKDTSCPGSYSNRTRVLVNGTSSQTVTPTASTITVQVTQQSGGSATCHATLTFSGIQIAPTARAPLASGHITQSGTATIIGVDAAASFGALTEIAGAEESAGTTTPNQIAPAPDTVAPVLTLLGHARMSVALDNSFIDPGVIAVDEVDGAVTPEMNGAVDTSVPGTYTITYTARDAHGNVASEDRTVIVSGTSLAVLTTTNADGTRTGVQLSAATSTVHTIVGDVIVEMPSELTLTGPPDWDGTLYLPTTTASYTLATRAGATTSAFSAVEIGLSDRPLTLDKAVKLTFARQAGKLAGWSQGGVFHAISAVCDAAHSSLPAGGDCRIDSGGDLAVWTKHFSTFITYTETALPETPAAENAPIPSPQPAPVSPPGSISIPIIVPLNVPAVAVAPVTALPVAETQAAAATVPEQVVHQRSFRTKPIAGIPARPPRARKMSPSIPQTAAAYDAASSSGRPFFSRLISALYSSSRGLLRALKRFL